VVKDPGSRQTSSYVGATLFLALAALFPVGLMITNPTLMFERGWEQYVGTALYFWAVVMLGRELHRLWRDEHAFDYSSDLIRQVKQAVAGEASGKPVGEVEPGTSRLILVRRVGQLAGFIKESKRPGAGQVMDVNRESSGLDQEQMIGRFTLTRYILYLLPVIGFIGTVEGISKALMNISKVLPLVRDLDAFLHNLTSVTAALQIAFDSTLLALFLSAALMLAQTLTQKLSEDLLARVDRWVVDHLLPRVATGDTPADELAAALGPRLDQLAANLEKALAPATQALQIQADALAQRLAEPIAQFAEAVDRLPRSLSSFEKGAGEIGRLGAELESLAAAGEAVKRGAGSLARIETTLSEMQSQSPGDHWEELKRGVDRAANSVESLTTSWSAAYERSSRATQEQLARSLTSLRDALDMLNVSMEQSNALYRSIVKKLFDERGESGSQRGDSIRVA
jgi:biopolymer transport protein ExbB/TolQ